MFCSIQITFKFISATMAWRNWRMLLNTITLLSGRPSRCGVKLKRISKPALKLTSLVTAWFYGSWKLARSLWTG
jgi:hypothetical protein